MKVIASILAACVLLLNTGNLLGSIHAHAIEKATGMACCQDQAADCCDMDGHAQDHQKSCEDDHHCSPGCHCSCGLHFTALVYAFMELDGVMVQSYHYGNYVNTYSFEYFGDFLQPPRKVD